MTAALTLVGIPAGLYGIFVPIVVLAGTRGPLRDVLAREVQLPHGVELDGNLILWCASVIVGVVGCNLLGRLVMTRRSRRSTRVGGP